MGTVCCDCNPYNPPRNYQFPVPGAYPVGPYSQAGANTMVIQPPFSGSNAIRTAALPNVNTSLSVSAPTQLPTANDLQLRQPAPPANPLRGSQIIAQQASGFVLNIQDPQGGNLRASRIVEENATAGQAYVPGFRGVSEVPAVSIAESLATIEKTGVQESGLVIGTRGFSGITYRGQWKGQLRHGMGIQTWPDGSSYEGYWFDGFATGYGKYRFPNGDIYEGQFKKDMANGKGVLTKADGTVIDGSWWDDVQHGSCREVFPDGTKFEGIYNKGKRNGQGRYLWADGSQYFGHWSDGVINGNGRAYWKDGRKYDGDWLNNRKHGKGLYSWPDGRTFQGDYQQDARHGFGTLMLPNGGKYSGQWARGRRHGKGTQLTTDGRQVNGVWDNGRFARAN